MPAKIYRISETPAWVEAERTGRLPLSELDRRDGFVHLSTADQVPGTLRRFFAGRTDLVLLTISTSRLIDAPLRYEAPSAPGDANELFPHYYGQLPLDAVVGADPLQLDGAGAHRLPLSLARELEDEDEDFDLIELRVGWDEQTGVASIEYPRPTRIEDEATIYAWEAALERRVGPIVDEHGSKVAVVICVDNLHVAPKLARRYTELADKVISRWFNTVARWSGSNERRQFFNRVNGERELPSEVFADRERALAHILESRQASEACSILSR